MAIAKGTNVTGSWINGSRGNVGKTTNTTTVAAMVPIVAIEKPVPVRNQIYGRSNLDSGTFFIGLRPGVWN